MASATADAGYSDGGLLFPLALLLHGVHHQGTASYTELTWVTGPEGTGKNPEIKKQEQRGDLSADKRPSAAGTSAP